MKPVPSLRGQRIEQVADWAQRMIAWADEVAAQAGGTTGAVATVGSGEVRVWAGSAVPTGWMECAGQLLLKTEAPALYASIGDRFAIGGEDPTVFRLPNIRGRTVVGDDGVMDVVGGSSEITLTLSNLPELSLPVTDERTWEFAGSPHTHATTEPPHNHSLSSQVLVSAGTVNVSSGAVPVQLGSPATITLSDNSTGLTVNNATQGGTVTPDGDAPTAQLDGGGEPLTVQPPYVALKWIIKL